MTPRVRRLPPGLGLTLVLSGCGGLGYYPTDDDGDRPVLSDLPPPPPVGTDTTTTSSTSTSTTPFPTTTTTPWTTTTTTSTSTTTGTPSSVRLNRVTPDFGTSAGGTRLTLTGAFDGWTEAYVDGRLATRRSRNANEMVVEAPSTNATGWVDVMVESGGSRDAIPNAFQYWRDNAGGTGAAGVVAYQDYVGGYWSGGTPRDVAYGRFAFTDGSGWELWQDYAPSMNECRFTTNVPKGIDADLGRPSTTTFDEYDPQASAVRFLGPAGEVIRLEQDPGFDVGWYSDLSLNLSNVVPGTLYELEEVAGGADWPRFGLTDALRIPSSFTVGRPRLDQESLPQVDRSVDLEWNNNTADYVVLWIRREGHGLFGPFTAGYMTCAMDDTGSFTIPANEWPDWYGGDYLYMKVGRVVERLNTLPHDDSTSHVAGVYWLYGAAVATD